MNFFENILAPIGAILLFTPFAPFGAVLLGLNIVVQTISFIVHTGTLMDVMWSVISGIGATIGSMILPGIYDAVGSIFSQVGGGISAAINGVVLSVSKKQGDYVKKRCVGLIQG